MTEIHEQVKKMAELLVLTDITDIQALSNLHSAFDNFALDAEKNDFPDIASASKTCSGIVESIVMGEVRSLSDAYQTLNDTVTCIQMFFEDKSSAGLKLPESLNDYGGPSAVTMKAKSGKAEKKSNTAADTPNIKSSLANVQLSESEKLREAILASTSATMTADPDLLVDFINEAIEHLDGCNEHLLTIEASPEDYDSLNAIFRAFHTIKGVASFLNLNEIRKLSHQTENLFDKARAGTVKLSGEAMDITFDAVDMMRNMIDDLRHSVSEGRPVSTVKNLDKLFKKLEDFLGSDKAPQPAPIPMPKPESEQQKVKSSPNRIARAFLDKKVNMNETQDFLLPKEMFSSELPAFIDEMAEHIESSEENLLKIEHNPNDKEILDSLFRSFHTIKGSSALIGVVAIEKLAHRAETLLEQARNEKILLEGEALDLVFNCVDILKYILEILKGSVTKGEHKFVVPEFKDLLNKIDTFTQSRDSGVSIQTLPYVELTDTQINETASFNKKTIHYPLTAPVSAAARESVQVSSDNDAGSKKAALKEIVKVDAERLDRLVDLIGELVIAETMVTQSPEIKQVASQRLFQNISHLDKITRELQAMGTYLRMVPLHATFQKMARLVRDLSKKLGKDIEFTMSGEDTELDKTVVDRIGDPLVHMVRNAVDHGVERTPADRINAFKNPKAKVELRAYHKGGNIFIEVEDDGRGLDKKAILNKAIERGIVEPDAQMDENSIFGLVFAPGFSTAENVTEVSGRGVGMDVVRRNIEALRGQVDIRSEFGKGSVFSIKLPLTMAIIDGMVVKVKKERYIIPTLSILMSVSVSRKDIKTIQQKGEMLSIQGELIPIFHLESIFDLDKDDSLKDDILVVIVEDSNRKTGIVIDELLGQQQIVIKNLGEYLKGVPGIAGGAIMPDGYVGLILDVGNLIKLANSVV